MSNGSTTGFISLQQAIEMTTRYRQNKADVINPVYAGNDILSVCDTFNKAAIETLLAKPDCTAIRLYYGMNANLQVRPMLVAVNQNNEDILPPITANMTIAGDSIVDDTLRCPPFCPPPSALNS
ncbi:MAG TPA: hypothetical protein VK483_14835 [Chitinophagaceae bacterium]|nr:hypothetical protein [Chitinophagaceae bacterium]